MPTEDTSSDSPKGAPHGQLRKIAASILTFVIVGAAATLKWSFGGIGVLLLNADVWKLVQINRLVILSGLVGLCIGLLAATIAFVFWPKSSNGPNSYGIVGIIFALGLLVLTMGTVFITPQPTIDEPMSQGLPRKRLPADHCIIQTSGWLE